MRVAVNIERYEKSTLNLNLAPRQPLCDGALLFTLPYASHSTKPVVKSLNLIQINTSIGNEKIIQAAKRLENNLTENE